MTPVAPGKPGKATPAKTGDVGGMELALGLALAHTQALIIEYLEPQLTQKEADIYRRGRNAKSYTMAKNATMADYRKATGLEAVIGYLYLTDQFARAVELTKNAIDGLKLSV